MKRAAEILETAAELVGGDRSQTHGGDATMRVCADLWSAYMGAEIEPADVARMMALMKMARARCGQTNIDHDMDAAGYCGIAGAVAK